MSFPKNSAFQQADENLERLQKLENIAKKFASSNDPLESISQVAITAVHTSDITDLEHELRDLEFNASSPDDARVFHDLANRVASFHKG